MNERLRSRHKHFRKNVFTVRGKVVEKAPVCFYGPIGIIYSSDTAIGQRMRCDNARAGLLKKSRHDVTAK